MSRFDYVKYDDLANEQQSNFKRICTMLEFEIDKLKSSRDKALAHTKLEECYMWLGKAIRDDQISRNGMAELQERCVSDGRKGHGFNGA